MLEDSLFESQGEGKTRKPITVVLAAIAHVVTIGALIVIPLLQTQALPLALVNNMSLRLPATEPPMPVPVFAGPSHVQRNAQADPPALTAPQSIPDKIPYIEEATAPVLGFLPLTGNGGDRALLSNLLTPGADAAVTPVLPPAPAPPPPPPAPVKVEIIRTGGGVQAALLIHQVKPVYPTLARQARIQGVVVMDAVINKEGAVDSLRVVSGHPLLSQAALDAVKQWRYRATLLNGEPVEVITTITVTFTFQ